MLTALLKNGESVCLGDYWEKSTLQTLRKKETFSCPQCHETVILKLGEKRIFHFSHFRGTHCQFEHESESEYHLNGKIQLYQWLKLQNLKPQMEYYDSKIKQRADILFYVGSKKYVLEYQCSNISEENFRKRTQGYLTNNYHPIWILGANQFIRKNSSITSLSDFHYLFLHKYPSNTWMIPYYCSQTKKFILQKSLHPISNRIAFTKQMVINIDNMPLTELISPEKGLSIHPNLWLKELNAWKQKQIQYHGAFQNPFLNALYQNHLNLFLLPPYLGIPVQDSPFIITPPLIWQTYLFIDILLIKGTYSPFHIQEIYVAFMKRIENKSIQLRKLPLVGERENSNGKKTHYFFLAVTQYIELLARLNIVRKINHNIFQLIKPLQIPKSVNEQRVMEESFYTKYANIIF